MTDEAAVLRARVQELEPLQVAAPPLPHFADAARRETLGMAAPLCAGRVGLQISVDARPATGGGGAAQGRLAEAAAAARAAEGRLEDEAASRHDFLLKFQDRSRAALGEQQEVQRQVPRRHSRAMAPMHHVARVKAPLLRRHPRGAHR